MKYLEGKIRALYEQGFIEVALDDGRPMGQAKKIIDAIIKKRSRGIGAIAKTIKIKLTLKGINPAKYTPSTPDDPVIIKKLTQLAEAYGAVGLRATKPDEVVPVLKEAFKIKDRPVFMDFLVDWKSKVFPMVPAGAAIDEMIFDDEEEKPKRKLKAVK